MPIPIDDSELLPGRPVKASLFRRMRDFLDDRLDEISDDIYTALSMYNVNMVAITSGSGNWTVPANVHTIKVICVGGGGGASNSSSLFYTSFGGGGGGATAIKIMSVTPGSNIAYSVGAGGNAFGGNGGSTTFGSISAGGGAGASSTGGGDGGTASGGDINIKGEGGGAGTYFGSLGIPAHLATGKGGSSCYGGGGRGQNTGVGSVSATPGGNYGGGAGGGGAGSSGGSWNGATGGGGLILIYYGVQ